LVFAFITLTRRTLLKEQLTLRTGENIMMGHTPFRSADYDNLVGLPISSIELSDTRAQVWLSFKARLSRKPALGCAAVLSFPVAAILCLLHLSLRSATLRNGRNRRTVSQLLGRARTRFQSGRHGTSRQGTNRVVRVDRTDVLHDARSSLSARSCERVT